MQLVITVSDAAPAAPKAAGRGDVMLDVARETTIEALVAAVRSSTYADHDLPRAGAGCYLGARMLDPNSTIEETGLVSGDHLTIGAPSPPPARNWAPRRAGVSLEVHAVGGTSAGRVWPVGLGTHGIGSTAGHRICIEDPPDAQRESPGRLDLTIDRKGNAWLSGLAQTSVTMTGLTLAGRKRDESSGPRLTFPEPPIDETGPSAERSRKVIEDELALHARLLEAAEGMQLWQVGVDLVVGRTLLRLVESSEPDAAVTPAADLIARDFNRPPRLVAPLFYAPVRLPSPPKSPHRRPVPLLMMLAPMVLGLVFVFLFHSYYFLLISLMSPVLALANWYNDRRTGGKKYRAESAEYREKRHLAEQSILRSVSEERVARCAAAPDPALVGLTAIGPGRRLWERRRSDPDFLVLRVGTADQPSLMELDDPARDEGQRRYRWTVPDVPVGIDLPECGVVGIAGPAVATGSVARWLVSQAAAQHSPRDLRVFILTGLDAQRSGELSSEQRWEWARWLPHVRPATPSHGPVIRIGNDPETIAHRVNELVQLVRARTEARASQVGSVLFSDPDVMVVMDGARRLRDVPGVVQILTDGPAVRVFGVCVDTQERLLPEECTSVVRCDPDGLVVRQNNAPDVIRIRPDGVSTDWCERVARALTSLRDVTPDESGGLPDRARLLDLLDGDATDARQIADGWTRRPSTTRFSIGLGFDGPVTFDLVKDGPHALIAGTTGSGKSELLQTMVVSLAAVNRPDELTFILVDYKGGSAFHSCVDLPHTLGMVTDLDEALTQRALESLSAELRRREHLLADFSAKDLPEYRAMRARNTTMPPMPRLVLVIDEFATLARETPSFVTGLVSIAQRGRSLGVHMILATQRPAGVVTADIKANTNLRIALRVTDPGESMDVIDVQDAAHIASSTPGRALARLAHRSTLPFQTAYVGSSVRDASGGVDAEKRPAPSLRVGRLTWSDLGRPVVLEDLTGIDETGAEPGTTDPTDLDALVAAIKEAAVLTDSSPQPSPWLPALPGSVLLSDLNAMDDAHGPSRRSPDGLMAAMFALVDRPAMQIQHRETFDLTTSGHLFVVGAPRSGRSQLIRTLIGSLASANSSADLHVYGIDAAGGALSILNELPHCGAVVPRADLERLDRLITWLGGELERRHDLFAAHSATDLTELRMALPNVERIAHIVVAVDGWDALAALLADHDGGHLHASLLELLREGAGVGIHFLMTSERALAMGRVASLSEHKLMLRMTDRTDFSMIGIPTHKLPGVIPSGRAWRTADQAEMQVALLDEDTSGRAQARALSLIAENARARDSTIAADRRPSIIAPLPMSVSLAEVLARVPESERRPLFGLLGIGGSALAPVSVDFSGRASTFLIAGPSGSGRSNTLAALGVSLLAGGTRLVVITPRESPLRRFAAHPLVHVATGHRPDPEEIKAQVAEGMGPTVILIDDVDLLGLGSTLDPVLRDVVAEGRDRGVGLAYAGSAEAMGSTLGGWMGEAKRSRQGILLAPQSSLEGELLGARLAPSMVRGAIRPGRGLSTVGSAHGGTSTVVIPHTVLR